MVQLPLQLLQDDQLFMLHMPTWHLHLHVHRQRSACTHEAPLSSHLSTSNKMARWSCRSTSCSRVRMRRPRLCGICALFAQPCCLLAWLCTVQLSSELQVDICSSVYIPSAANAVHGYAVQLLLCSHVNFMVLGYCCVPCWMQRKGSRRCGITCTPTWSSSTPFTRSIRSPTPASAPSQGLMRQGVT